MIRLARELSRKRLELLKEAVPRISRVGVLWDGNAAPGPAIASKEYEAAARSLNLEFQSLEVRGPDADVDGAFQAAAKGRANGLIVVRNAVVDRHSERIIDLAIKNRLPSVWEGNEFVEAGGLMSYSSNDPANFRRVAVFLPAQFEPRGQPSSRVAFGDIHRNLFALRCRVRDTPWRVLD